MARHDAAILRTRLSQMASEATCIEVGNSTDPPFFEVIRQALLVTKITGSYGQVTDDQSCRMHFCGLGIIVVDTDISYVRIGQCDHLVAVGRVSQDFLISRHGRVEDNFSDTDPLGANRPAAKQCSVSQGKNCRYERRQDNPWSRCDKRG